MVAYHAVRGLTLTLSSAQYDALLPMHRAQMKAYLAAKRVAFIGGCRVTFRSAKELAVFVGA